MMPPSFGAINVGDAPAPLVCGPLTRTDFVRYAGASHDFNPNHHDEVYAKANGNKAVFGMGMLAGGYCARLLTDWLGDGCVAAPAHPLRVAVLARRCAHLHRRGDRKARGRRGEPRRLRVQRGQPGRRGHHPRRRHRGFAALTEVARVTEHGGANAPNPSTA